MMAQVARRIGRYALIAYEFSKPHIIRYYHQLRKAVLLIKNQLLIWFYKYKIPTKFHQLKKALAFTFEEVRLWIDLLVISIHQLYTQLYQQSFALFHSLIGHFQ
jgi:hypothetical protein